MIEFQAGVSASILKSGEMRGLLLQFRAPRCTYDVRTPPRTSNSCPVERCLHSYFVTNRACVDRRRSRTHHADCPEPGLYP